MPTEREKMLAGELYDPLDAELVAMRLRARELCHAINSASPANETLHRQLLEKLLAAGPDAAWIQPPFYCDYGVHIYLGRKVFFNFNCVVLDVCEVRIGDFVKFGPAVQIYTATHPLAAELRRREESGKPITIGDDVWIGGGAILCPGVNVGSRTVIGAGSVVTRDIPANVFTAGNPCRVIREIS
ncbi:MAG TPA: sugar O-acetyltransferase [Lacipirellula sp.]